MSRDPKSNYYDQGGLETIDIIRAKLTPEQYQGYILGNALKYLCRCNWKHDTIERDTEKAGMYLAMMGEDANKPMHDTPAECGKCIHYKGDKLTCQLTMSYRLPRETCDAWDSI